MSLQALGVVLTVAESSMDRKVMAQFMGFWRELLDEERSELITLLDNRALITTLTTLTCAPAEDLAAIKQVLEMTSTNGHKPAKVDASQMTSGVVDVSGESFKPSKASMALLRCHNRSKGSASEAIRQYIDSLPKPKDDDDDITVDRVYSECKVPRGKRMTRVLISWVLKEQCARGVIKKTGVRGHYLKVF